MATLIEKDYSSGNSFKNKWRNGIVLFCNARKSQLQIDIHISNQDEDGWGALPN